MLFELKGTMMLSSAFGLGVAFDNFTQGLRRRSGGSLGVGSFSPAEHEQLSLTCVVCYRTDLSIILSQYVHTRDVILHRQKLSPSSTVTYDISLLVQMTVQFILKRL